MKDEKPDREASMLEEAKSEDDLDIDFSRDPICCSVLETLKAH